MSSMIPNDAIGNVEGNSAPPRWILTPFNRREVGHRYINSGQPKTSHQQNRAAGGCNEKQKGAFPASRRGWRPVIINVEVQPAHHHYRAKDPAVSLSIEAYPCVTSACWAAAKTLLAPLASVPYRAQR